MGNRKLHKNEDRALRAFAQANIDKNIYVLFSGKPSDQLVNTAKELQIEDRVKFLGRLSEDELASTYKGALCLLFPSLYEGFGLPAIEAMACGTPVITSNTTALFEIGNNETLQVNPENIKDISTNLEKIIVNKLLREELISNGLKIVLKYDWSTSKKKLSSELNQRS